MVFGIRIKNNKAVLALGAESAGNFSVFREGEIFLSEDFGDLLKEENFNVFQMAVLSYLKENKIKPDIIVADLHPLYVTTVWGRELAEKFDAEFVQVQHHIAHIMSAIGDKYCNMETNLETEFPSRSSFIGIACDGTGYGLDEKIWGGEIIKFQIPKSRFQINAKIQSPKITIERIGHLENQVMIGGDLAVREPARMAMSILDKFSIFNFQFPHFQTKKEFVYDFVKDFYTKQEFEVLYSQLQQGFNCQETSSAGRVLDAVSVSLGFVGNERGYKHEATRLLEEASDGAELYDDIEVKISNSPNYSNQTPNTKYQLLTTPLFEYLINGLAKGKDKKRLAVTAQLYIAKGLWKIISTLYPNPPTITPVFLGGGITNNKIIFKYFEEKGAYLSRKIPRGDAGLSFGQIFWVLYNERKDK